MGRPRKRIAHPDYPDGCVIAYMRVSTDEQSVSGAGLDAQRHAIELYASRAGLTVSRWAIDDGVSGSVAPDERPALSSALDLLAHCHPGVLIFAKLDRLTRLAKHWLDIRERANEQGWMLSATDGSVDTLTPHGRMMAGVMAEFAEYERELIRQRTRDALASRKAQGTRLGRPVKVPGEIRDRIVDEKASGSTLTQIAEGLNADGVPTASGKSGAKWYASTVRSVLGSIELDAEASAAKRAQAEPQGEP
jgi:DNA invertase Pin-like site-specific DNA recombinase